MIRCCMGERMDLLPLPISFNKEHIGVFHLAYIVGCATWTRLLMLLIDREFDNDSSMFLKLSLLVPAIASYRMSTNNRQCCHMVRLA